MHLLLGDSGDPCCQGVQAALEARGYPTHILANPMAQPSRFTWRLDNEQTASRLAWLEEPPLSDDQIRGVLVRRAGWVDASGWAPDDLAYMHAETQAALLGWLWSLPCPVVNRYPSAIWYQPRVPLLSWQPLLGRCGLSTPEAMVTNVEDEARAFGRRLAREGVPGVVYGPLTADARYLVVAEDDWTGLAALQRCAPVCLAYPSGAARFVCVVGERVVWEGEPSPAMARLEPALRRFAESAGLTFVGLALAPAPDDPCVVAVEPHPHFDHFGDEARQRIVEGIVELLLKDGHDGRADAGPRARGRYS